jgi:hypothetical protein
MNQNITYSDVREAEETLAAPNKWLQTEIKKRLPVLPPAQEDAEIQIYAYVSSKDTIGSVHSIANWKPSDLYAYSEAPRIELLNAFDDLVNRCNAVAATNEPIEFELKTVELWQCLQGLNAFLGITGEHDELIAVLLTLSSSSQGRITREQLTSLREIFERLRDSIGVTDALLDEIENAIEVAGFDLQFPMSFSEPEDHSEAEEDG